MNEPQTLAGITGEHRRLAGACLCFAPAEEYPPRPHCEWAAPRELAATGRIFRRIHRFIPIALLILPFARCGPTNIQPIVDAAEARVTEDATIDWSDWGLTLSRVVEGREVNYHACIKNRGALDRFLAHVAYVGPNTAPAAFPGSDYRLAYLINCYNATILRSLLEFADDGAMPSRIPFNLEGRFRYRIDGEWRTPGELRRAVHDRAGDDWRVRFTLCDGSRGGPSLWRRPFLGDMLDAQLNQAARFALASPQVVEIDHAWQRLRLWSGLHGIAGRLIREHEDRYKTRDATILNALLVYADRPRREQLNSAVGYDVALLPSDNRINAFEPITEKRGVLDLISAN